MDITQKKIQAVCGMVNHLPLLNYSIHRTVRVVKRAGEALKFKHARIMLLDGSTKILEDSTTAKCIHDDAWEQFSHVKETAT